MNSDFKIVSKQRSISSFNSHRGLSSNNSQGSRNLNSRLLNKSDSSYSNSKLVTSKTPSLHERAQSQASAMRNSQPVSQSSSLMGSQKRQRERDHSYLLKDSKDASSSKSRSRRSPDSSIDSGVPRALHLQMMSFAQQMDSLRLNK